MSQIEIRVKKSPQGLQNSWYFLLQVSQWFFKKKKNKAIITIVGVC